MTTLLESSLQIENISVPGYQKVVTATNKETGLKAIICIHDMRLGKAALGGLRIYPYATFDDALTDVLRLSKGMTYKSAVSQVGWGGGKSVIIADPKKDKNEKLLASFAEFVNSLKGEYICAEDSGCTLQDAAVLAEYTPYIVGIPNEKSSGNPSPFTAWGTFRGIQACLKTIYGDDSVAGRTIAIQGLGSVGSCLAELLFWHGAKLILADIHAERAEGMAKQFSGKMVPSDKILEQPCDVLAPCALGAIINPESIKKLQCRAIAGCANNQLLTDSDGDTLKHLDILYAPDFLINSGGLINVSAETHETGYNPLDSRNKVDQIYNQLLLIFDSAKKNNISTNKAAVELCDYRLKYGIGKRHEPIYLHHANVSY